jgi:hypothetical protein
MGDRLAQFPVGRSPGPGVFTVVESGNSGRPCCPRGPSSGTVITDRPETRRRSHAAIACSLSLRSLQGRDWSEDL